MFPSSAVLSMANAGECLKFFHWGHGEALSRSVSPNPPMDTDGRREDSGRGGEGVTGAMIRARIRVDGRLAAVCRRFWGRRWRPTVAVVSEMAG